MCRPEEVSIVIITICIAASVVLAVLGLVIRMLLGLKRDIAVNRAVLRASLTAPRDPPLLTTLESESEKAQRRHGMHIVRSGPLTVLGALVWRARRHMWRTAGISSAAVGGTLMVAAFALGAPPTPPGTPTGRHLPTIGATEPVAAPSATGPAPSPSTVATSSAATNDGAQTVVVVAAPKSSTGPAPILTPTLPTSIPSVSSVEAPIVVSSSSTCMAVAAVPGVLGVCVL